MRKSSVAIMAVMAGTLLTASPAVGFAKTMAISRNGGGGQQTQEQVVESKPVVGAWQVSAGATSAALTEEELDVFERAFDGLVGSNLTPVAVIATQLVSGTNYAYLVQSTPVVPNATPHWTIAVVYRDLEDNVSATSMRDIDLANVVVGVQEPGLMGSWEVAEAPKAPFIDGDAKAAFDLVAGEAEDIVFEPVALLGSQVAEGTNYKVLAVGTSLGDAPSRGLWILTVNANPYGGAGITGFERPDLVYYTTESNEDVHAVESVGTPASGGRTLTVSRAS